jgi:hypothetical protein
MTPAPIVAPRASSSSIHENSRFHCSIFKKYRTRITMSMIHQLIHRCMRSGTPRSAFGEAGTKDEHIQIDYAGLWQLRLGQYFKIARACARCAIHSRDTAIRIYPQCATQLTSKNMFLKILSWDKVMSLAE